MSVAFSTHCVRQKCIQILVGKVVEKSLVGRPRCRWKNDNIKTNLKEIG